MSTDIHDIEQAVREMMGRVYVDGVAVDFTTQVIESLRAHHVRPGVPARSAHTSARHVPPGASAPHLMRAGYRPDTHYATRR